MQDLMDVRVTDNRPTELPPAISGLTNLRGLHLRQHRLTTLPDAVALMGKLRRIDLRENPITSLPETSCRCHDWRTSISVGS
jgi:Leucine-rich repeat (LRR) protein